MNHSMLEWFQEVLLEFEMRKFLLLEEAHSKLSQRINGEKTN